MDIVAARQAFAHGTAERRLRDREQNWPGQLAVDHEGRIPQEATIAARKRPTNLVPSLIEISLHVCSVCGRAEQLAAGELVPVDEAVVEMAACDAQHHGQVLALTVQRAAN